MILKPGKRDFKYSMRGRSQEVESYGDLVYKAVIVEYWPGEGWYQTYLTLKVCLATNLTIRAYKLCKNQTLNNTSSDLKCDDVLHPVSYFVLLECKVTTYSFQICKTVLFPSIYKICWYVDIFRTQMRPHVSKDLIWFLGFCNGHQLPENNSPLVDKDL